MRRLLSLFLVLFLLPAAALGEAGGAERCIVRLTNLTEEYLFPEGTPLLEVVFPRVLAADCAIVRFGDEVWLIDAATGDNRMHGRIRSALTSMGVTQIDVGFNSHPHSDHIGGFARIDGEFPIGEMLVAFDEDYNEYIIETADYCRAQGIPMKRVGNGDVLTMGPNGEVTLRVFQRNDNGKWQGNNNSAMLLVTYGDRTILFTGDVENHAQRSYGENPPEEGIRADILKYPHHGKVKLHDPFLEAIDPAFAIITGASGTMDASRAYLRRKGVAYVVAYHGLTRMRTDGQVWVVDYMHEISPDRDTKNPNYQ